MRLETHFTERRLLTQAISDWIHEPIHYDGVPSCSYSIGPVKVMKDGSIETEDADAWAMLIPFFRNHGWMPEEETEQPAETVTDEKQTRIDISMPADDFTADQLTNLLRIFYSKQVLLNRSFNRGIFNIPAFLIVELEEQKPKTPEEFTSRLDGHRSLLDGFDFRDGKVTVSVPYDENDPTRWETYALFFERVMKLAKGATRVRAEIIPAGDNEKYYMNSWLARLGFGGADFKALRKLLLENLTGCCAFPDAERAEKHKAKYAELRRAKRDEKTEVAGHEEN